MNLTQQFAVHPSATSRRQLAFTMIEIAICLAIIGFALVAIIGVLPTGMQVQKDNRQDTIINQDATYLIDAIRSGARGADDLTNYVDAITNKVTVYTAAGTVQSTAINGYTRNTPFALTNGARIIGLLSIPKYQYTTTTNNNGDFINYLTRSNHVTAYIRAISGSAVEKATNADARSFAFSYRMVPEIIPYTFFDWSKTNLAFPGRTNFWQLAKNQQAHLHEVRLLFRWPVQPNGIVGNGRQIFRSTVSSQVTATNIGTPSTTLYFFEPRSYVRVP